MRRVLVLALLGGCWWGDTPARAPAPLAPPPSAPAPAPIAAPRVTPRLTPEIVVASISTTYLPALRRCYTQALRKHAGARGRIKLAFAIDPAGRVVGPAAYGAPPRLAGCIVQRMQRWSFPAAHDTTSYLVPLQLHAE